MLYYCVQFVCSALVACFSSWLNCEQREIALGVCVFHVCCFVLSVNWEHYTLRAQNEEASLRCTRIEFSREKKRSMVNILGMCTKCALCVCIVVALGFGRIRSAVPIIFIVVFKLFFFSCYYVWRLLCTYSSLFFETNMSQALDVHREKFCGVIWCVVPQPMTNVVISWFYFRKTSTPRLSLEKWMKTIWRKLEK